MVADMVFILVFILVGGLLGLIVEAQKQFFPIYLALLLLGVAALLDWLGKVLANVENKGRFISVDQ